MRTCVGCRQASEQRDLLRLVLGDDGKVVVDLGGTAFGRGAWVHPRASCLTEAVRRGLARSLKAPVCCSVEDVFGAVRSAAERRVQALIAAARASGKVAVGSDAVGEAVTRGAARLVVVAVDARSSAQVLPERAAPLGVVWGDKVALGAALGRGETGVVAVLDPGLSDAIRRSVGLSTLSPSDPARSPEGIPARLEVR